MLKKTKLVFRKSFTVVLLVLIILGNSIDIEASKSRSRTNHKSSSSGKANRDHVALSYGGVSHGSNRNNNQQSVQSKYVPPQHSAPAPAPSAPKLPDNNKPIGWNVQNSQHQQQAGSYFDG